MNRQRRLLLGLTALAIPGFAAAAGQKIATPRQTPGPFYPDEIPLDDDSDLTRVRGNPSNALGQVTDLSGRILNINGTPLNNLRIEIWQCDVHGRYRHPNDRGGPDPDNNFQGHGKTLTNPDGVYRFRTIRPVPYPGRTPHIHIAVFPDGERPFTTQLYVAGDARNEQDFLYRQVPVTQRPLVTSPFRESSRPGVEFEASFDIVLGGDGGTPAR